jgi:hypothetical protein
MSEFILKCFAECVKAALAVDRYLFSPDMDLCKYVAVPVVAAYIFSRSGSS